MERDPIVEEIRAIREEYLKRFDYDLEAIYRDLKAREGKSSHEVVSLTPKRIEPAVKCLAITRRLCTAGLAVADAYRYSLEANDPHPQGEIGTPCGYRSTSSGSPRPRDCVALRQGR